MYDVCIPSLKNPNEFEDCILAIKQSIPGANIIIDTTKGGRANSRTSLLKKVKTEYFFFIDDDIIVNSEWFDKVMKKIKSDDKIGAVAGFGFTKDWILRTIRRMLLLIRGTSEQRGFTSNTVIRKSAIKGIELTDNNRFEDFEFQKKVIDNGYRWETAKAYCIHTKSTIEVIKDAWHDFKILVKEHGLIMAFRKI